MPDYRPAVVRLPEGGHTGIQLLCLECGSAVADTGRHDRWHEALDVRPRPTRVRNKAS